MIVSIPTKVPGWVKWIAIDENGEIYGYAIRPTPNTHYWVTDNNHRVLGYVDEPDDYTKELYQVIDGGLVRVEE